jgi:Lon protease-like protein
MSTLTIPLFPLNSVLFPGGPLPLRIFEPRYLDMVSRCLKEGSGFGVVLIRDGDEVGEVPQIYDVGTFGRISYWEQRSDGLLGITVTGEQRFRILHSMVQPSRLIEAEVTLLPLSPPQPLPKRHAALATLLQRILDEMEPPHLILERDYANADWVSGRLVELLPLDPAIKQRLLQEDDPLRRLDRLAEVLGSQMASD